MEIIYHILGVCPDAHSHFDLSDLFITWDSFMLYIYRLSFILTNFKATILSLFK